MHCHTIPNVVLLETQRYIFLSFLNANQLIDSCQRYFYVNEMNTWSQFHLVLNDGVANDVMFLSKMFKIIIT